MAGPPDASTGTSDTTSRSGSAPTTETSPEVTTQPSSFPLTTRKLTTTAPVRVHWNGNLKLGGYGGTGGGWWLDQNHLVRP